MATTETGLMVSSDAGVTFALHTTPTTGTAVVIDHVPTAGRGEGDPVLAGRDVSGQLWTFDGRDWTGSGDSVGSPQAFTAIDAATYLAAFDAQVYRTADAGETWLLISPSS